MFRILALVAALIMVPSAVLTVVDPHDETDPRRCESCHEPAIRGVQRGSGEFHLVTDTVDGVCLVCHRKEECCEDGQAHQGRPLRGDIGISHSSDLDVAQVKAEYRPKTLPVFDGRITCNTCHLHNRGQPKDYKLVRMVTIKNTRVDWTALCRDCHDEI